MLWKFYKNDPDVCHYLFGTMHLATEEAYTYVDLAKKYILLSSRYAGEMDLNVSYQHDMTSYFVMGEGSRFQDFFRPKQYQKARKIILKAYGKDIAHLDQFTPFYIHNFLAELSLVKTKNGALDHFLWEFAMSAGKEMDGVESFDEQVRILQQIPMDYQIKSLKDSIKNLSTFRRNINHLNTLYAKGACEQLYKSSKKSMGRIRKVMIYDRNVNMKERIKALSSDKTCFFAIGTAHFPGGKGILALLKKDGYKIQKLS
ncbi:MAG: TraB/GumN family protein [Saprospiraceae bacterium]|nr:TraB/GumN family protein [Saprospiraceae bacterium]